MVNQKKVPVRLWDFGWKYCHEISQRTSSSRFGNNGRTPLEILTGETPDIFEYLDFDFYQWVYFKSGAGVGENHLGRWLGVSHRIGNSLCYFVIRKDGQVLSTTTVSAIPNLDLQTPEMKALTLDFDTTLRDRLRPDNHVVQHSDEVPDTNPASWRQLWSDSDPEYDELVNKQLNDPSIP